MPLLEPGSSLEPTLASRSQITLLYSPRTLRKTLRQLAKLSILAAASMLEIKEVTYFKNYSLLSKKSIIKPIKILSKLLKAVTSI